VSSPLWQPPNREIDFAFVSCSCRACERAGEAKLRGRVRGVPPHRWALGEQILSRLPATLRSFFVAIHVGFKPFWAKSFPSVPGFCAQACGFIAFLKCTCCVFMHRHVGL